MPRRRNLTNGAPRAVQRRGIRALSYVVFALLTLAVAPPIIVSRAQHHRRLIADVIEPARIASDELEALSLDRLLSDTAPNAPASARTKRGRDAAGLASLDTAALVLGPGASTRVAALLQAMRSDTAGFSRDAALRTISAADSLQEWLDQRVDQERTAAASIERWFFWLPLIIVPLVLLGVAALAFAGKEIIRLSRVAQDNAASLAEATESRASLLRGVTHDLKNPLGAARGYAALLLDGVLGELTKRSVDAIQRIDRLLADGITIVQDLTELARAEGHQLSLAIEPTAIATLLAAIAADHAAAAQERGLRITLDHAAGNALPPVMTDPRRLRQILENLVSNAVKYTPSGGVITLSVVGRSPSPNGHDDVRIVVSDTGPGIPDEMRDRIFDEFVRLPSHDAASGAQAPSGTGVGLAISRRLARLLGGDLTVQRGPAGGAQFVVALPLTIQRPRPGIDGIPSD